jgi:GntR family transcriptional regulator, transcriptional repressor for pyruvate dehydrogenase complex
MISAGSEPLNVRVPKTAELVATHIRRQIVLGQLHEGDALPSETALMMEFNISRPTLREAFRILESEGLITVRRGARGGARVQEPSSEVAARYAALVLQHRAATLDDVLKARLIVEAPAARVLASRRDRAAVANKLQERLDTLDPGEPAKFHEFNALLVELAGNETLMLLASMLDHISTAAAVTFARDHRAEEPRLLRSAHRTRQKLIDLIRAGNAEAAEKLWRDHLTETGRILVEGTGAATVVDLYG